jgi:hypothetical protein
MKRHASSGENYNITFKRDSVTVSGYETDSTLTGIETWAETVVILA